MTPKTPKNTLFGPLLDRFLDPLFGPKCPFFSLQSEITPLRNDQKVPIFEAHLGSNVPKMVKLSQITPKVVKKVFLRKQLFFQTKLFDPKSLKKHLVF
jgi:hypothetical protein